MDKRYAKFFCDISGTFTSSDNVDRKSELNRFVHNLTILCQSKNFDYMEFSFVTSDSIEYLNDTVKELNPYLIGSPIILGVQYSANEKIESNKVVQAVKGKHLQMLESLRDEEDIEIFYAEDILINHMIANKVIKKVKPNIQLTQFIVGQHGSSGLSELNELLEEYIKSLEIDNNIKR